MTEKLKELNNAMQKEKEIEAAEKELFNKGKCVSILLESQDIVFLLDQAKLQGLEYHNLFNHGIIVHQLIEYFKAADVLIKQLGGNNEKTMERDNKEEDKPDAE